MAGLYVHIPFCKTRCIYCAFHSGTDLSLRDRYVEAICKELRQRCNYLTEPVSTIYFGGGTPSQLFINQLKAILEAIKANYEISTAPEITIECNPDDLTEQYAEALAQLPFNRISMGVQSFCDEELKFLNRRHTAQQAIDAVKLLQTVGFKNISIDLMFGLPGQTLASWQQTLQTATQLGVQHISAYSLTYEGNTTLVRYLHEGRVAEADEELSLSMFQTLISTLEQNGFEQYEISNFCKLGFHSRHNSAYWHGIPYLGIGAAAHSFDGTTRQWNIANTLKYIEGIEQDRPCQEIEELSCEDKYNELVMTSLRTKEGVDLQKLNNKQCDYCLSNAQKHINSHKLVLNDHFLRLTREGIFVSDGIMSDLFYIKD